MRRPPGYVDPPPWAQRKQSRTRAVRVCLTPDEHTYLSDVACRMTMPLGVCLRSLAFGVLASGLPKPQA